MPLINSSRRRFVSAAASSASLLALGKPARAQGRVYKLAHPDNIKFVTQDVCLRFAAEVERRTNGRIKMQVFPGGSLGSEINLVQSLQTGIIDFAIHTAGYLESFVPTIQALDLPFIFKDNAVAERVLDGDVGKQLAADMTSKNLIHLAWGHYGWRNVQTVNTPVTVPGDLKGLKIRVQAGPVFAAMFKAIGAVPVVMDVADIYVGLQQRTIDGIEYPWTAFVTNKYYEVIKIGTDTRHVYNAGALMASKPTFDSLSAEDQQIVRSVGAAQAAPWRKAISDRDRDNVEFCRKQGIRMTSVNYAAFRDAMTPVYADFKPRYPQLVDRILAASR